MSSEIGRRTREERGPYKGVDNGVRRRCLRVRIGEADSNLVATQPPRWASNILPANVGSYWGPGQRASCHFKVAQHLVTKLMTFSWLDLISCIHILHLSLPAFPTKPMPLPDGCRGRHTQCYLTGSRGRQVSERLGGHVSTVSWRRESYSCGVPCGTMYRSPAVILVTTAACDLILVDRLI